VKIAVNNESRHYARHAKYLKHELRAGKTHRDKKRGKDVAPFGIEFAAFDDFFGG